MFISITYTLQSSIFDTFYYQNDTTRTDFPGNVDLFCLFRVN